MLITVHNQKNNFLVLNEEPADGISDSTVAAEKTNLVQFEESKDKILLKFTL